MHYWEPLLNSNCKALFLLNYFFGFWLCDYSIDISRLFITYYLADRCSFYLPLDDLSYFDRLPKPPLKINETVLQKCLRLNAKHNNMAAAADAGTKQSWSTLPSSCQTKKTNLVTNWTHALTKTANKTVFEEIKKVLEERMSIEQFKEENISSFIWYWQLKNSFSAFLSAGPPSWILSPKKSSLVARHVVRPVFTPDE